MSWGSGGGDSIGLGRFGEVGVSFLVYLFDIFIRLLVGGGVG